MEKRTPQVVNPIASGLAGTRMMPDPDAPPMYELDTSWRQIEAEALDAQAHLIDAWIAHSVELSEMLEQRDSENYPTMVRSAVGHMRALRDELASEAQKLRLS